MKQIAILALLATGAIAAQAQPSAQSFIDRARVQSVQPQYETVQVPRQECSSQWVTENRPVGTTAPSGPNIGGAVIGGVAGGILGHQVGKGSGRDAATAVGAIAGAIVGDRVASNGNPPPQQVYEQQQREVRTCRTVNDVQQRPAGYLVTYEYKGLQYTSVMREQPGNTVPVRVSVSPIDEREYHRN